jgi:hypothetical protein
LSSRKDTDFFNSCGASTCRSAARCSTMGLFLKSQRRGSHRRLRLCVFQVVEESFDDTLQSLHFA